MRGEVKDDVTAEPVYNATVKVDGVGKARTDFEGAFTLRLAPGTYTLTISNPTEGYIDAEQLIEVTAGNVTNVSIQIGKSKAVQDLTSVKVVAKKSVGSPTTLEGSDKRRMEESAASDELPKETIKNSGVTNAADAVQMVPAASVEQGKNVYIRGLGDRYTKTILNGMDIPGLDPDRNSVQMDIFPAVMIDNITVYKTFTPNLSADFTGGLVNIQTKDFPGRHTLYVKAGLGYNNRASFNSDFLTYQGGKLDFLGFDDGTRALPISPTATIPHPAEGNTATTTFTGAFSDIMSNMRKTAFLNQNYAFAEGNQINIPRKKDSTQNITYGYNAVINYRTNNTFYKDVEYNEFQRDTDLSETQLFRDRTSRGELGVQDVMWTALLGQSIKFNRNKISLVAFRTQNGTSSSAILDERNFNSNQAVLKKHALQYTQRSVTNLNLSGLHFLDKESNWKLNWTLSPTASRISDPDIRSTALEVADYTDANGQPVYLWEESVGAEVRRIFRDLKEYNASGKFDFNYKFHQWDSLESNISFGGKATYKNRSFDVSEYVFRLDNMSHVVPDNPDFFFDPVNIWTIAKDSGVYAVGQLEKANIYQANQLTSAFYVMNELPITEKFVITYGVRAEHNINRYTGQANDADYNPKALRYENEVVLNKLNILPSANFIYKIRKEADSLHAERSTNFRWAYTQTLARPSFREISISQIYDPIQGRRYLGNINLKQTLIHNADVRWEHFFGRTEIISASAFYKRFINPIEVVANVAAPNEFKPVNAGTANVYGAEFEIRKAVGFKQKEHVGLLFGSNFAYIISQIDMRQIQTKVGDTVYTEKEVRQANARDGEVIGNYRPMYGQAPWIVNAYVTFRNDSLGVMFNLTYNVQGKRLAVIGVGSLPDVYDQPFHSLNFKATKTVGKIHEGESAPRWEIGVRGQNLLNFARRQFYEAYNADPQIFSYLNPGITISGQITYTIR